MLFTIPRKRGKDAQGSGAYGAPRGSRKHKGLDYWCKPGTRVYSAISGRVTRLGYPYKGNRELRLIEIETDNYGRQGELIRYMYIQPVVMKGDKVLAGDLLGVVQKHPAVDRGMKPHVHVDVRQMVNKRRKFVDPEKYFEEYWA